MRRNSKFNRNSCIILNEGAGIGACMDVKAHNGMLYAIQKACYSHRGRLAVLYPDLSPVFLYNGIGNARQIEIVGNLALVTAREDGLWIFDISDKIPKLVCQYRTVEFATGVALCGNLAFISCRQYGVEIVDISNPERPKQITVIRVGEVQSATVDNGILYCGVWGEMKVVVVDISTPAFPRVLSEIELQGRGDGVCVSNGVLYAATGQHARGIVNVADESDPAFGRGNGVECFDVSQPSNPKRIGGKLFETAFCSSIDLWEPAIYGDTLVVNNSILGVYGLDPITLEEKFRIVVSENFGEDAVTGVTSLGGDLFVATGRGDLYAVRGMNLKPQSPNNATVVFDNKPRSFEYDGIGGELSVCYGGNFPVLSVTETETDLILACGEGGVRFISKATLEPRAVISTLGKALDVRIFGNKVYVAEGIDGLEIFNFDKNEFTRIGCLKEKLSVNQIALSRNGRFLMCALGSNMLKMYDLSNDASPEAIYEYRAQRGPLYGNNFPEKLLPDGTMVLFCHRDGLIYSNPEAGDREFFCIEYIKKCGFCSYCAGEGIECIGDKILYTIFDGFVELSREHTDKTLVDELSVSFVEKGFKGLLTVRDNIMIASIRPDGIVYAVDISSLNAPNVLAKLKTSASPSKALICNEGIFIPGGRNGLLSLKIT